MADGIKGLRDGAISSAVENAPEIFTNSHKEDIRIIMQLGPLAIPLVDGNLGRSPCSALSM